MSLDCHMSVISLLVTEDRPSVAFNDYDRGTDSGNLRSCFAEGSAGSQKFQNSPPSLINDAKISQGILAWGGQSACNLFRIITWPPRDPPSEPAVSKW